MDADGTERSTPIEGDAGTGSRLRGRLAWSPFARRLLQGARDYTILVLLAVILVAGGLLSDVFLTPQNLLNVLWAVSLLGILSLGQTVLLITCNFDLSVARVIGLAGSLAIMLQAFGLDLVSVLAIGLAIGVAVGLLNGLLVVGTRANPFLITLGTGSLSYAVALVATKSNSHYGLIPAYNVLGRGLLFGVIPYSVVILVVLAVLLEVVLQRTPFGRSLYMIGLNDRTSRLSGIQVNRVKLISFVFCGFLAAATGILYTSRTNLSQASQGFGMEFDSLIAAILGGTSLFGGRGGALRTLAGVFVLGVINNLFTLLNVQYEGQQVIKGAVFLVVVWADSILRRE